MNGLFLLYMNSFLAYLSGLKAQTLALISVSLVAYFTILCSIIALKKGQYTFRKRLWVIFDFIAVCIIESWLEQKLYGQITYLPLTIASCLIGLSICLFLPTKEGQISPEKRAFAQFLDRCAKKQNFEYGYNQDLLGQSGDECMVKPSKVLSSPITSAKKGQDLDKKAKQKSVEIDFSHIKGILAKLEYYPLKEQDKKSAKELEKAIFDAEQNGLDASLKQTINDGLGALLKIMAKYAV